MHFQADALIYLSATAILLPTFNSVYADHYVASIIARKSVNNDVIKTGSKTFDSTSFARIRNNNKMAL